MIEQRDEIYGSLLLKRVGDTTTTKAIDISVNVAKFTHKVSKKIDEENRYLKERVKQLEAQLYSSPTYQPPSL